MSLIVWVAFLAFILSVVALDLGVFHRKTKPPTIRKVTGWTIVWISMALLFNFVVFILYENNYPWVSLATEHLSGSQAASQFLLGCVLEKSLSLD